MRAPDGSRAPLWTPVPGTVTGANRDALVCWEETAGASAAVATPAVATRGTAVAAMVRMGVISCSWGWVCPDHGSDRRAQRTFSRLARTNSERVQKWS